MPISKARHTRLRRQTSSNPARAPRRATRPRRCRRRRAPTPACSSFGHDNRGCATPATYPVPSVPASALTMSAMMARLASVTVGARARPGSTTCSQRASQAVVARRQLQRVERVSASRRRNRALQQAHAVAAAQINRRNDDHGCALRRPGNCPAAGQPTRAERSGWKLHAPRNCHARTTAVSGWP